MTQLLTADCKPNLTKAVWRRVGYRPSNGTFVWWDSPFGVLLRKQGKLQGHIPAVHRSELDRWAHDHGCIYRVHDLMPGARDLLKQWMQFELAHEAPFHYKQSRPIPLRQFRDKQFPIYTDCSGTVTCLDFCAGLPDPNGRNYDGSGFTGTIRANCPRTALSHIKVGDRIVYGDGTGDHVVMVYDASGEYAHDPLVFSHGQETGPRLYRHSMYVKMHGSFTCHTPRGL